MPPPLRALLLPLPQQLISYKLLQLCRHTAPLVFLACRLHRLCRTYIRPAPPCSRSRHCTASITTVYSRYTSSCLSHSFRDFILL